MLGVSGSSAPAGGRSGVSPHRILFTDATQGGVLGGSLTGVLQLLAHLDRARFEPVFVLFAPKPIAAELEAEGIRVHVLPPPRPPVAYRGSRPRRALAKAVNLWRVVGSRARQLVQILGRER